MAREASFLAVDLGAESGRVFSGAFTGEKMALREVHRFSNTPVRLPDGLYWDALHIFEEVKTALAKAASHTGRIESVGTDSWGVDFALLDASGAMLGNPRHYRDSRAQGMVERACELVAKEEIYGTTGIQFMRINTLCQLLAMREQDSPLLGAADTLLMIPDLINYWLSGEKSCEHTNATTTQLYDPRSGEWAKSLIEDLGIPKHVFGEVARPATTLGRLLPEVAEETGLKGLPVVAVASHDTAAAVAAVPASGDDFAYISSGTWSLVGVETDAPVTTQEAMEANFTNEGGFGGRTRFLKNVMGLWILQECRKEWSRAGRDYSYEELERLAREASAPGPLIDPDHPEFLAPGDMSPRLRRFCEMTGQEVPDSPGGISRCVLESLALKYALVLEQAQKITGKRVETVHAVGGGSQNALLCQLTAETTRLPVVAGPIEATALGNAMVQAFAKGYVGSLEDIRRVVGRSVEPKTYEPRESTGRCQGLKEKFIELRKASHGIEQLGG